jgi:DMSO/TMAO reductase YedYZ molybdopterin-dependent catalytic subunit
VVPRLLGYKNPKYVNGIELVEEQPDGFWPQYGYTIEGEVPAARLRPGKY